MTKDEALKLALEALHGFIPYLPLNDEAQCGRYDKALIAIKETLAQPEQEPVAWRTKVDHIMFTSKRKDVLPLGGKLEPLYTTPPQRTWVGLTDEEWNAIYYKFAEHGASVSGWDFAKAIEAKLKEKNT